MRRKHGSFELVGNKMVIGPERYMERRLNSFMDEIQNHTNRHMNQVIMGDALKGELSADDDYALLRALQLDFEDWKGSGTQEALTTK